MASEYVSKLGPAIAGLIAQKRAMGYPYDTSAAILGRFDAFAANRFPGEASLTKDLCMAWATMREGEHQNTLLRRVTPVRQLGKYIAGKGGDAYVIPGHIPSKQVKYAPHVFTEGEVAELFASIDSCPASPWSPLRHYVIPVFFRLVYCCGLRQSEARLLARNDVDLRGGRVVIRESKGWESRVVYMSDGLLGLCRVYDGIIESEMPGRVPFFPNASGGCYSKSAPDTWFHEFWDALPCAAAAGGNPARVHDLRHAYAVHRLNSWVREGRDTSALYPYLSEFMGHSHFADTDYYLTLSECFYGQLGELMAPVDDEVLPEVVHHEA